MSKARKWVIVVMTMMLALVISVATATAGGKSDVRGLVFIDDNLNGHWDQGEAGYGGEFMWYEADEINRYVGTTITIVTPSYEEITVETSPYREPEEHETIVCSQQDLVIDGEINPNPVRPCSGTWGLRVVNETYLEIWVTAPDGYYVTSPNPQYYLTGTDSAWVDFGVAPIGKGGSGDPVIDDAETIPTAVEEPVAVTETAAMIDETAVVVEDVAAVDEVAAVAPTSWTMDVGGTGYIPGLVFIDTSMDGVWQPGEPGYGGELTWNEDIGLLEYVGAAITLIPPSYDEVILTSAGYIEPAEGQTMTCTQQDLVIDGGINPNPVRPCDGTWGLSHAGDDILWEVWLTIPDGYSVTSANPQQFTTGSGQMPVDFGIVPIE